MKKIAILGSTGSIGVNTLDVLSRMKSDFKVVALSADSNTKLLAAQARRFRPRIIAIGNGLLASQIKKTVPAGTKILAGAEGLCAIASTPDIDMVVFAISGNACLIPLLEAIRHKKEIALANKEAVVSGGPIVTKLAKERGVRLLPIDSEHSAIFQCIEGRSESLSKIYLTGSGGPLLDVSVSRFDRLPPNAILKHPKWNMGKKISVDSATMMNKGLEIIEARHLFAIDEKRIEVLIHPEAIIHSMVEFSDGAVLAQMAVPDMRLPIQYALTYPERVKASVKHVDFAAIAQLTFRPPDTKKFPCLGLARKAARAGGTAPAVLCAADEEAVKYYLEGNIKFTDISDIIEKVLARHRNTKDALSVEDIVDADAWAREEARSLCYH
jgi:1-deoxy-D-xylulose-5-phosphate reductoisomerase